MASLRPERRYSGQPRRTWLRPGVLVHDPKPEMIAVVEEVEGFRVKLRRPSGMSWTAERTRLRPATAYEHRQFRALAALQRLRQKGLACPDPGAGRLSPGSAGR